jgi:hypothetical protein
MASTFHPKRPSRKLLLDSRLLYNGDNNYCMPWADNSNYQNLLHRGFLHKAGWLATPEEMDTQISFRQSAVSIYKTDYVQTSHHQRLENGATDFSSIDTRSEAWTAYRSICLPSMRYSLSAISFARQEFATIQRSPIQVLLSAMGFN